MHLNPNKKRQKYTLLAQIYNTNVYFGAQKNEYVHSHKAFVFVGIKDLDSFEYWPTELLSTHFFNFAK